MNKETNINGKIVNGSFWTLFSNLSTNVITFGITVLLARLLSPEDFGIVSISAVFTGIVMIFQDLGLGSAIIQRKDIDDDYLNTSFTVSLMAGGVMALLLLISSPFIARFYNIGVLRDILILSSAGFLISPFTSIHNSLLAKKLEFRKLAGINILMNLLSGAISVGLALSGYGVWSIVLGKLVAQPLMIPVVWKITGWVPRIRLVKSCFTNLFGFSSKLLAFNMLNHVNRNFDNLVIGKYLGAQTLGYYSVAYTLMLKPLQLISWSIGKVLFPVFSKIQDDPAKTREIYLKTIRTISLVTFPMMTGLLMVATEFVLTVYGERWAPAIKPLQFLCVIGAIQSVGTTSGVIFNAYGRPDISLNLGIGSTVFFLLAFVAGVKIGGLMGLITGYLMVTVPVALAGQYFSNRLISQKMTEVFKALLPATFCSFSMVAVLMAFKYLNRSSLHLDLSTALVAFTAVGFVSYWVLAIKIFKIPEASEALQLVKRRF